MESVNQPVNQLANLMSHWEVIAELGGQDKIQRKTMKKYFHDHESETKYLNRIVDHVNGYSVMHELARKGHYNALIVLQKFGGDLDLKSRLNGLTPRNLLQKTHPVKAMKLIEREKQKAEKKQMREELEKKIESLEGVEKLLMQAAILEMLEVSGWFQ